MLSFLDCGQIANTVVPQIRRRGAIPFLTKNPLLTTIPRFAHGYQNQSARVPSFIKVAHTLGARIKITRRLGVHTITSTKECGVLALEFAMATLWRTLQ